MPGVELLANHTTVQAALWLRFNTLTWHGLRTHLAQHTANGEWRTAIWRLDTTTMSLQWSLVPGVPRLFFSGSFAAEEKGSINGGSFCLLLTSCCVPPSQRFASHQPEANHQFEERKSHMASNDFLLFCHPMELKGGHPFTMQASSSINDDTLSVRIMRVLDGWTGHPGSRQIRYSLFYTRNARYMSCTLAFCRSWCVYFYAIFRGNLRSLCRTNGPSNEWPGQQWTEKNELIDVAAVANTVGPDLPYSQ